MISHDARWPLPHGNTLVPSRWQATGGARAVSAFVLAVRQCRSAYLVTENVRQGMVLADSY
jgi:hypothetical protein